MRVAIALISFALPSAKACTTIAMGRLATADGSVIVAQSDDGDVLADTRLIYVPPRDFPEGALAPSFYTDGPFPRWVTNEYGPGYAPNDITGPKLSKPIGYIPQVRHTFGYQAGMFGIINENNVGIGESTCSAVFKTCAKGDSRGCEEGRTQGEALLDSRMLTTFAMERARTAREAVEIIGNLSYEYGFYGTHDPNGDGESLVIGDADEAWVMHYLADDTGSRSIWAAVRVPDDGFTIVSNTFTIREINVQDTANCLASPNVYKVAEDHGWWKPGQPFDFTRIYSNGEYFNKYYAGRRMWRALNLVAPSLNLSPEYDNLRYDRDWPWAVKPDRPLSLPDVFSLYRDWFAGTPFDMTKGLAAGFAGTPDRFETKFVPITGAWERSIAIYRTGMIRISHLQKTTKQRPREVAGVAWIAPGPAHYSPFLPVPSGISKCLPQLSSVSPDPKRYSKSAFNWQVRHVMMTAQIRFDHMHPMVENRQHEAEQIAFDMLSSASDAFAANYDKQNLTNKIEQHIQSTLDTWGNLSTEMYVRFSDNSDLFKTHITPDGGVGVAEDTAPLAYPIWWLRAVGFDKSLEPVPPQDQCPPVCPPLAVAGLAGAPQKVDTQIDAATTGVLWIIPGLLGGLVIGRAGRFDRKERRATEEVTARYAQF
eukprot:TRINITY_DN3578_c1_g1_i6.p1 TRINITY_DN3578_c1_g1~~TRINITY_DN3578_c1_g1_i6.p1  ORF type:complete len:651 (+),score=65.12 TRINITY_DN3578_c1_g1_i6:77-2029(+)